MGAYPKYGREVQAKSALSATGLPGFDYCLNPYIGCRHGCKYCYASFMKRFTGHSEPWGAFLDARVNMPQLLQKELERKKKGPVIVSSVTDPYQPAEAKYKITRHCLKALAAAKWPVSILTKSPKVLRDIDIIEGMKDVEVGITISTDLESIRHIFEPNASPLAERKRALRELKAAGIDTYVFVGPILPMEDPEKFAHTLGTLTNRVLLDRMNYIAKTRGLYRRKGMLDKLQPEYFDMVESVFRKALGDKVEIL